MQSVAKGTAAAPTYGNADHERSPVRLRWLLVLVALVTALAFLPILSNGWVDRDDPDNFLDNPSYRGIGLAQLRWAISTFYLGVYQPLAWMLLGAQYEVCGLMPWGYHLSSLVMHCANAVLLVTLAAAFLKLGGRRPLPEKALDHESQYLGVAAAALLFAVHPLRVEVVAWVSCQPYLPCAFFTMLAVLAYLRREYASAAGRAAWLVTAWLLYVLALLCKAPALTLPAVLLLIDVFPLRRFSGELRSRWASILAAVLEKLPFVAVGVLFFVLTVEGKYISNPLMFSEDSLGLGQRLARSGYSAGFYIEKTVWPSGLAADYEWFETNVVCRSMVHSRRTGHGCHHVVCRHGRQPMAGTGCRLVRLSAPAGTRFGVHPIRSYSCRGPVCLRCLDPVVLGFVIRSGVTLGRD